ncbi:MAG: 2-oxoacid:ferredoxin oxidoreductase subunit gamma [Candidatus Thermoplasmatota archaeon]|nr:2-oxoacid:ferredoxin oxidoreductase subunit gamma [Candidatus Thermoplasmatota archaeon]MDI6887389.1 2-oxoacid:ferredoxin oxidoreductase subunit gamma [Candidatus Thermoplasmatota archaeon]
MRKEILLAGFGGQGIILAGYIIGKASALYDGKNAVFTQSYGPEARGGACSAEVIISDVAIDYPYVTNPDVVVVMAQEAYRKYANKAAKNGILIADKDLVSLNKEKLTEGVKVYKIGATKIAEQLGKKIVANIVMLGYFTKVANIVSVEAMKKSLLDSIPKGTEKLNLEAFELGFEYLD